MRISPVIALTVSLTVCAHAKGPKVHSAGIGKSHVVTWTTGSNPAARLSLMVAPLIVDDRRKDWVTGEQHDVTDHSFVVLEVERVNDALPTDPAPHFIWQTGAWLLVDRTAGRVTPLHLAGYDPALSGISWFRDYAAYCSLSANGKVLSAEIMELGSRKPVAHQKIAEWPLPAAPTTNPTPTAPANATPPDANQTPAPPAPVSSSPLGPIHHGPAPRVPSVFERMNTGLPHPAVCTLQEWDRDPLRAVITPRPGMPPVQLDLNSAAATATEPAPATE